MSDTTQNLVVGIIEYDCGNIRSVINAVEFLKYDYKLISKPNDLTDISIVILPGVGAFDYAVESLQRSEIFEGLKSWIKDDAHYLIGICLGMQLLCTSSEESANELQGLNLIPGIAYNLNKMISKGTPTPHVGWNTVYVAENDQISQSEHDFYFVHSYGVVCDSDGMSIGVTEYGGARFSSIISNRKNVIGFQFHPEKSHDNGLQLLRESLESVKA